jgi:hypothetical protein
MKLVEDAAKLHHLDASMQWILIFEYLFFLLLLKGRYISYMTFCQDCDCDDPNSGCGWTATNYGRVECTSCDKLKSMNNVMVVITIIKIILLNRMLLQDVVTQHLMVT